MFEEEMKSLDKGQFSQSRYALLFEASEKLHEVDVRLGYYTSVYGLGRHPKDTQVRPSCSSTCYCTYTVYSTIHDRLYMLIV